MPISDLIPWKRENKENIPVQREQQRDALLDLRQEMNQLFDDFFQRPFEMSPFRGESSLAGDFIPQMDVTETEKEIKISVELPGMDAEDIDISMTGNRLSLKGEKREEKEEKGERFYRSERSYGSFQRSIPLPEEVQEEEIEATYINGVLNVNLPKSPGARKGTKKIEIQSS
ncbi:MAG: Hsp20/alpha crystallin family protein [Anaerolineales bacterium]|nr:Hsp20/alpha crystallin family protein [Anaerolineales bacterium]MBS3752897.1 Hsp20/alpha crystallin family protein [Anaerolineales bacterium]